MGGEKTQSIFPPATVRATARPLSWEGLSFPRQFSFPRMSWEGASRRPFPRQFTGMIGRVAPPVACRPLVWGTGYTSQGTLKCLETLCHETFLHGRRHYASRDIKKYQETQKLLETCESASRQGVSCHWPSDRRRPVWRRVGVHQDMCISCHWPSVWRRVRVHQDMCISCHWAHVSRHERYQTRALLRPLLF